jgi:nitrite reductase/ring-hydroxylating ferredoxin subunit
VTSFSKITFFLIVLYFACSFTSCKNSKNDVIPDVYVDFTLDLADPEFIILTSVGQTVTVNEYTNNFGLRAAGYSGNGIIVHSGVDEFFAYDRTCPHDYVEFGTAVKIEIDNTNSLYAVCPQCKTKYGLPVNGTPAEGVGRYPLKNYKTSFDGRRLRVWNNY